MKKGLLYTFLTLSLLIAAVGSVITYKSYRLYSIGTEAHDHLRYLIDSGEPIGDVPASSAFASGYLQAVFGDNPELLQKLKGVIQKGLDDTSKLSLQRVSAMLVTYRIDDDEQVIDVATHIIGDQRAGRRKPGFHRDGYFKSMMDRQVWGLGNTIISFLGKEIVYFAQTEVIERQEAILNSLFSGEIAPIVTAIEKPYQYTLVIPNPRRLLPPQLRHHVQTLIIKGALEQQKGSSEAIILCSNEKSAKYTMAIMKDLKTASESLLRTKFDGRVADTPWGPTVQNWWAFEMVMTSDKAILEREESIVKIRSAFGRPMVNALLKSMERMGRDLAQMRAIMEEGKDPRLVDYEMRSPHPNHYWSASHKWGPNWPIAPLPPPDELLGTNIVEEVVL